MTQRDRITSAIGIGLVLFIIAAMGVVILAGMSAPAPESMELPNANWTVQRVNDSYVQLSHAGGEPVPGSALAVSVDGIERPMVWTGQVEEGETGLVSATTGQTVRLYWISGRDDRVLLEQWEV